MFVRRLILLCVAGTLVPAGACNKSPQVEAQAPAPAPPSGAEGALRTAAVAGGSLASGGDDPPQLQRFEPAPEPFAEQRKIMVDVHLRGRDITDKAVLTAMLATHRHLFVPAGLRSKAYNDSPLPIGHRQTISQPYIVALMTQMARIKSGSRVLDVGTGSGYQAAVLAQMGARVHTIEILCPLAERAAKALKNAGYGQVVTRCGDGYGGWPKHAPFDAIIVAAAPDHVPKQLVAQLAKGGRLVIPVGGRGMQKLLVIERKADGTVTRHETIPVRFVPMTGGAL